MDESWGAGHSQRDKTNIFKADFLCGWSVHGCLRVRTVRTATCPTIARAGVGRA